MSTKLSSAVIEAWAGLVRTEKAVSDRIEERLKGAGLPSLDWFHVLHEVDRSPKGMMRQSSVQIRTQIAQYSVALEAVVATGAAAAWSTGWRAKV